MSGFLLDTYPAGATIYVPWHTFDSNGASITLTGLAVTDVEIYKNGSVTQRASDNGYTLLDTDGIDFDGITGIHGLSISLADNSDSGFYAAGSQYTVVVSSVTVDTRTVNFVLGSFRITNAETVAGTQDVNITALANNVITAASIAPGAIDAATFAADTGIITVRTGTAQAGAGTTITLDAGASAVDNFYSGDLIFISSGTGAGQARFITSYVGATKVATVPTWVVNPDNTSVFVIQPFGVINTGSGLDAAATRAALGLASANLDTQLGAIDDFLDTEITDIRNRLPAALVSGRMDASVGAMAAGVVTAAAIATDAVDADALAADALAEIKTQVVAALNTDTYAEPGQATPAATATLQTKIAYLYKFLINQKTQTATQFNVYNNASTVIDHKATVSDDGTTATRQKLATGP